MKAELNQPGKTTPASTLRAELRQQLNHISFHTPAHNGGVYALESRFDVTELSYSDNLLSAHGALLKLQARWALCYGADRAFLFTNGATGAIFSAIYAVNGKVAIVGDAHVSVFHALEVLQRAGVFCKDAAALATYLSAVENKEAEPLGAIFITYPSYAGTTCDLAALKALADRANAVLVVDSAHGSHFAFCSKLPVSASKYSSLVIYSAHKTLPVLTGGALIACSSALAERVECARRSLHTTSPSYLTLLSFEDALEKLAHAEEDYTVVLATLALFKAEVEAKTKFWVQNTADPTRLVLSSPYLAEEVAQKLEQKHIFCEYFSGNQLIFIVTPYNKQFLSYLAVVLAEICQNKELQDKESPILQQNVDNFMPNSAKQRGYVELLPPSAQWEVVPIAASLGRTLNGEVGLYPPGVPMLFAGEKITAEMVEFLQKNEAHLFGLAEQGVFVVK